MVKRKKYSEEFRKDAVRLVQNRGSRSVDDVARELRVNTSVLTRWQRQYVTEVSSSAVTAQVQREDVEQLRRRLRELEMENSLLKKAAALFAKEMK
jgi:transposase